MGFGILLAAPLERFAVFLVVLGILLHGYVLIEAVAAQPKANRTPWWWTVIYWLTWTALALASSRACA